MAEKGERLGALKFRVEGEMWNCYYDQESEKRLAVLMGSIRLSLVAHDEITKEMFMGTMQGAFDGLMQKVCGIKPIWDDPQIPAGEKEGTG